MNFWASKLGMEPQQPAQQTRKAWWQDDPQQVYDQRQLPQQGYQQQAVAPLAQSDEAMFRQLQRVPAGELTQDQMEFMAEHELSRAKYNQSCPQCGSNNFVPAGNKIGGVLMPTDKCFECGAGVRSPEPALGGRAASTGSVSTRQIDTGGGAGSMYLQFRGVPSSYRPRS